MKSKISIQNVAVTKQCIDVTYTYTSGLQSYFHIENNVLEQNILFRYKAFLKV